MKKARTITSIILTFSMMFSFPVLTKAATNDNDFETNFSSMSKGALNNSHQLNTLDSTFKKKPINANYSEVSAKSENTRNSIKMAATSRIANKYSWSSRTLPFDFSEQTWSRNKDVFRTYAQDSDKNADTRLLCYPESSRDYELAIREGYVDDAEYAEFGVHKYKHVVSLEDVNDVTFMLEKNVGVLIFDSDSNLVYNSVEQSGNANYIKRYTSTTKHIAGADNNVYNLGLATGTYYFMIGSIVDNPTSDTHYAFYCGQPLPIEQSYTSPNYTHDGVIHFHGNYGGTDSLQTQTISIDAPDGYEDQYALYRVKFEDKYKSSSLYVQDISYFYKPPTTTNSNFIPVVGVFGQYYDNFPPEGSIEGDYDTEFMVTWMSSFHGSIASCRCSTLMTIYYLAPFGIIVN